MLCIRMRLMLMFAFMYMHAEINSSKNEFLDFFTVHKA